MPFTAEQFFETFARYNADVWPAQVILIVTALIALNVAVRGDPKRAAIPPMLIAALWIWSGAVYHIGYFRRINPIAVIFGALFIVQGLLLAIATWRDQLALRFERSAQGWTGAAIALYALVIYPLLGAWLGHRYPASPTFGAPCPLTILTLGMLLWGSQRRAWYVLGIPLVWAAVGTSAALSLGVIEDLGLAVAAIATTLFLFWNRPRFVRVPA